MKNHAQTVLALLDRVDLKGSEVPLFIEARNWVINRAQQDEALKPAEKIGD